MFCPQKSAARGNCPTTPPTLNTPLAMPYICKTETTRQQTHLSRPPNGTLTWTFVVSVLQVNTTYKCVTWTIFDQQITLIFVSLKTIVNRPIVKLYGKNIICVRMCIFFMKVQFFIKFQCTYNIE